MNQKYKKYKSINITIISNTPVGGGVIGGGGLKEGAYIIFGSKAWGLIRGGSLKEGEG